MGEDLRHAKGKAVGFLKNTLLKKHVFKKNSNSDLKNQLSIVPITSPI